MDKQIEIWTNCFEKLTLIEELSQSKWEKLNNKQFFTKMQETEITQNHSNV